MAKKILCNESDLVAIGDAVRGATGSTESFNLPELSAKASEIIGSGCAVQADWSENNPEKTSYVQNRTHYEVSPTFDIQWDGNIGDRFALDMSAFGFDGVYFVKVSGHVPTFEQLYGSCLKVSNDDYENIIMPEYVDTQTYAGAYDVASFVVVVYDEAQLSAMLGVPSGYITNGTYFYTYPEDAFFTAQFIGKDTSKKLDVKYLPEGYPHETEPKFDIIWDGNMEGRTSLDMTALGYEGFYFVKVSDEVLTTQDILDTHYYWRYNNYGESAEREVDESMIDTTSWPGIYAVNQEVVVVHTQEETNAGLGLPDGYLTNGVYFASNPSEKMYVTRFTGNGEVVKIDEKYLPDGLPSNLATVATTGNYNDLINRPTVYTDVVRYSYSQGLNSTQKSYARSNIDVYSKSEVDNAISAAINGAIGGSY